MSAKLAIEKLPLKCLPFGAVLLAEPGVPLEEMQRDLKQMIELGFNTVVLYPSVSRWDAVIPGQTAFDTIDVLMDTCAENGMKAVLELQGQVMQDADAPECTGYVQAENYRENGFHQPQKEALLDQYLREVVTHFKGHPALLAYDVFNEIGNYSRSPETIAAFVVYLKNQYDDIQALNRAWATYFIAFEDICRIPPNFRVWSWSSVVAERDWQRFRSADFTAQLHKWRAIIREIDPVTPLFSDVLGSDVLQNRTGDYFGASDWDVVEATDVHGLSCYANMLSPKWWEKDAWLWPQFWRHALSVADGKQTVISELMTQNRCLFPTENSSMTDELGLWSYQAIFHGIQGLVYWKYRPFRRGRQVAGRGLTDFDGTPNAFAEQASEVARFTSTHADMLANSHPDNAGCAIVFDPDVERLLTAIGEGEATTPPGTLYTDAHRGWFHAFWQAGINPRYVAPQRIGKAGIPEDIRVLVAPCLPAITPAFAKALADFMQRGGTLVTDARFGVLDIDGNLQAHAPGFGLHSLTGVEEKNFACRGEQRVVLPEGELYLKNEYFQGLRCEDDVEVLLKTQDNQPALVTRPVGQGSYVHLPLMLGNLIERDAIRTAALACFEVLLSRLKPQLAPVVPIHKKSALLDAPVLLRGDGTPWLLGLTNFSHEAGTVDIMLPKGASLTSDGCEVTAVGQGVTRVVVPARTAVPCFFEK